MTDRVRLETEGFKELSDRLKKLPVKTQNRLGDNALRAGARLIVKEAKENLERNRSVRTGELQDAISARVIKRNQVDGKRRVDIGAKRPTSMILHLVEFGTRHSAPKPFMRPALDSQKANVLKKMAANLKRGIEREFKKLGING